MHHGQSRTWLDKGLYRFLSPSVLSLGLFVTSCVVTRIKRITVLGSVPSLRISEKIAPSSREEKILLTLKGSLVRAVFLVGLGSARFVVWLAANSFSEDGAFSTLSWFQAQAAGGLLP